LEFP